MQLRIICIAGCTHDIDLTGISSPSLAVRAISDQVPLPAKIGPDGYVHIGEHVEYASDGSHRPHYTGMRLAIGEPNKVPRDG
jgi:hypothetical protein